MYPTLGVMGPVTRRTPSLELFSSRNSSGSISSFSHNSSMAVSMAKAEAGAPGGTIGGRLGPVDDDVICHEVRVGNVVLAHHALSARGNRRAWKRAGLIDQRRFRSHHLTFLGGAELDPDLCAGGGPGGLKDLLAGHLHLYRMAALAGQQRRDRLHVHHGLGSESASRSPAEWP